MQVGGIILSGGKGSRMGQEKGLVVFRGKPMVQWVLEAAQKVCEEVTIVAHDSRYAQFGVPVVPDAVTNKGPLAGIVTGLENSKIDYNLVLSCDIPLVNAQILTFLVERSQGRKATLLTSEGRMHPLIGVYRQSALPELKDSLSKGLLKLQSCSVMVEAEKVDLQKEWPGFDSQILSNFNTMQEIHAFLEIND